jgi:WD40 repeat protein
LKGHTAKVNSVAFSPDGKYVVSISGDKSMILWNVEHGTILGSFPVFSEFYSLCWTSKYIFTGQADGSVSAWKVSIVMNVSSDGKK